MNPLRPSWWVAATLLGCLGFFPGLPLDSGAYFGFGVKAVF